MTVVVVVACAVLGLLVGSFLNVVIWRVPRGESIVRPPSHCPGCDQPIRPRDNIPVVSWVLLRGRCRHCGVTISWRYPLVELLTAGVFAVTAVKFPSDAELPAFLYLAAIGVALSAIDIDTKRLPNAIVLPSYLVSGALLAVAAAVDGDGKALLRAGIGMAALYAFYFVLAFIYPSGMGFGDVKLAGVLGMHLGWVGYGALVVGGFGAFLVGGLVGLALMLASRAGRKTQLPFGPYMILAALIAILCGQQIGDAYWDRTMG